MRTLLVLMFVAPAIARADDRTEAQALFDLGVAEMKQGKLDEACRHLAASLAKLQDSGTKGALAVCTTRQGKVATAWTLWRDLAVTAPTEAMKNSAARAAKELEPRLPRYQITSRPQIAGLVVTINGAPVDLGVDVPLPVDPGKIAIRASAPEHRDHASEATAEEGQLTRIEIPALVAVPGPAPVVPDPIAPAPAAKGQRGWQPVGLLVGGGAAVIAGAVFGLRARSLWDDARRACGDIDACPGPVFASASNKYDSARTSAAVSTVLVGVGAAAMVGGGVWWYLRRGAPRDRTALVPVVTDAGVQVVFTGSFR